MSKGLRVACCADVSICPEALDGLRAVAEVELIEADQATVLARIAEFDGYLASLKVRMDREMLDRARRLRVIATPSTGLDHIDMARAVEKGIRVISIKTEYGLLEEVTCTAEMAWALLLAAVRKIPWSFAAACEGQWARDHYRGHQLSGKTLGVVGCGRLGRMVVDYGKAFRMRVLGCDVKALEIPGVEMVDMDTLLGESDVISIHVHLTPENTGFLDAARFAKMKDGVVLINTSRGAVVDEAAFLAALESGRVGAAGVDVLVGEWREDLAEHPLVRYARTHENLVISPHTGGVTFESQSMTLAFTADRLAEALRGGGVNRG